MAFSWKRGLSPKRGHVNFPEIIIYFWLLSRQIQHKREYLFLLRYNVHLDITYKQEIYLYDKYIEEYLYNTYETV